MSVHNKEIASSADRPETGTEVSDDDRFVESERIQKERRQLMKAVAFKMSYAS